MIPSLTIVIPCYNEVESLPKILPELIEFVNTRDYRLIVTNDGSKDNSLRCLEAAFTEQPRCQIVNHKINRGYGGAIKSGIAAACTDFVITIDADGQHHLDDIDKLFKLAVEKDADLIVGSRKGLAEASVLRGVGKSLIRSIARVLMPLPVYDINSGMKLYATSLAKKYLSMCPDTMAYSDIITLIFANQRHLVLEEPIQIRPRLAGKSTIGIRTAYETVMEILTIVIMFNPMRVFLPLSAISVSAAIAWAIPIILRGGGVSTGAGMLVVTGFIFFVLGLVSEQLAKIRRMMAER